MKGSYHSWPLLCAILLLALGLRLGYLRERCHQPDYRFPQVDAGYFDYWARGLATGNWSVPLNFGDYPDPKIQSTPYFRPPGYPYFLAGVYRLCGTGPLGARLVQLGLGCLNILLAFVLGRRLLGRAVGLIFALLMSVTWTFIYFEAELLATTLAVTLVLVLWLTLSYWCEALSLRRGLAGGLVFGLLTITRANALLFGPVVLLWLWWMGRRREIPTSLILRTGLGFVVTTIAVIAPVTLRNYRVAHDKVLISSNGGYNLYVGNNENADGSYVLIPDIEALGLPHEITCFDYPLVVQGVEALTGYTMKHSEVSSYFAHKAWGYARHHPGRTLKLLAIKTALFWGSNEVSNNKNLNLERAQSFILRCLPGFPLAFSLGILGFVLGVPRMRWRCQEVSADQAYTSRQTEMILIILLFVLVYFISYLPFFVAGRFRVPIMPGLLLMGAWGINQSGRLWSNRQIRAGMGWLTLWGAVYGLVHVPLGLYKSDDVQWHLQRATCYRLAGDRQQALKECRDVVDKHPTSEKGQRRLADLLMYEHQYREAIQHYLLADQLKPNQIMVHMNLATAYTKLRQPEQAIDHLNRVLMQDPNQAQAHYLLASLYRQQNQFEPAIQHYRRASELAPRNPQFREDLAHFLLSQGRVDAAIAELQQLLTLPHPSASVYNMMGIAWKAKGDLNKAIEQYEQALALKPDYPQAHNNLANVFAQQQRWQEAVKHYRQALALNPNYTEARTNLDRILKIPSQERQP